MSTTPLDGLQYILKASNKKLVDEIFQQVYRIRTRKSIPEILTKSLVAALQVNEQQASEVMFVFQFLIEILTS